MLAKLKFDAKMIEGNFPDRGLTVTETSFEEDGKTFKVYTGNVDPEHHFWKKVYPNGMKGSTKTLQIIQDSDGFFWGDFNFNHNIEHSDYVLIDDLADFNLKTGMFYSWKQRQDEFKKPREEWNSEVFNCESGFGVADNPEQVLKHFKTVINNPDVEVVISFTPIYKSEQPEDGGWRWHKWGTYIGDHEIQHEYLYDEEGIEKVLVYQVYPVKKKEVTND